MNGRLLSGKLNAAVQTEMNTETIQDHNKKILDCYNVIYKSVSKSICRLQMTSYRMRKILRIVTHTHQSH
jgi:site-specific DNA-adenine methylase